MVATPEQTLDEAGHGGAEQVLADEARRRPRAAVAAFAAAVLMIVAGTLALPASIAFGLLTTPLYADLPSDTGLLEALRERPADGEPGFKARQVLFYDDHALETIGLSLLRASSAAALALALGLLFRSIQARQPALRRTSVVTLVAGCALIAVGGVAQAVTLSVDAAAFADGELDPGDARDVLQSPTFIAALLLNQMGVFALGIAFALISLNAMRVGLLTRFMGVLGVLVGVLVIAPLASTLPLVQFVWLLALGSLLLGRWPGGMPPAWTTGVAQPWPTRQQIAEARFAEQATTEAKGTRAERRRARVADAAEIPAPELPERKPHSSSKKKKGRRKR